jgi:hypothetical protein
MKYTTERDLRVFTKEQINNIEFELNEGYLINRNLGLISKDYGRYQDIIDKEINKCEKYGQVTDLMKLILHPNTECINEYDNMYCPVITGKIDNVYVPYESLVELKDIEPLIEEPQEHIISNKQDIQIQKRQKNKEQKKKISKRIKIGDHRYISPKYKTDENINNVANNYGCYAIYNETLKTVYIGETIKSFHQRWNEHYTNKTYTKKRTDFLNHPDTICTIIYTSNGDKEETERLEAETIQWYKDNLPDWTVLGGTYRDNCWYNKGV